MEPIIKLQKRAIRIIVGMYAHTSRLVLDSEQMKEEIFVSIVYMYS